MVKPVKMRDALKTEQALQDQFGIQQAAQESNFKCTKVKYLQWFKIRSYSKKYIKERIITGDICTARKQLSKASSGEGSLKNGVGLIVSRN